MLCGNPDPVNKKVNKTKILHSKIHHSFKWQQIINKRPRNTVLGSHKCFGQGRKFKCFSQGRKSSQVCGGEPAKIKVRC